jgi:effector-binding domain-containing protein
MSAVELVTVESRLIAAVKRRTAVEQIPKVIVPALDVVWPAVRAKGMTFGRNVVVYRACSEGEVEMECGVEVADRFDAAGEVVCVETPTGTAAMGVHVGPYQRMLRTYEAIGGWMREHRYRAAGRNMEVYGHWEEDPARLRTEIYIFIANG